MGPSWELAAVYCLVGFLVLISGPGRYSLDQAWFGRDRSHDDHGG